MGSSKGSRRSVLERPPDGDRPGSTGIRRPPDLLPMIDSEQLGHKLGLRMGEVVTHSQQRGFPAPIAYFRGRMLWDESEVDRWLAERP